MSISIPVVVTNGVVIPRSPLPEGAEVMVLLPEPKEHRVSMLQFVESLPPGPRAFKTWEEYEQHLRAEKDAWER